MLVRGAAKDEDWTFGQGRQSYLTGNDAIAKNIETKLRVHSTECFYDTDAGLPWFTLLAQKTTDALLLAVQTAILETEGVLRVTSLSAQRLEDRSLVISYTIDTLYSANVSGSVTV
jgi:hypothetical protein